jgi:hypothetical protein
VLSGKMQVENAFVMTVKRLMTLAVGGKPTIPQNELVKDSGSKVLLCHQLILQVQLQALSGQIEYY